jgi:type IV secretory pathway TrbD component
MIDFRSYTTVPKNFDFERTLAENYRLKSNNEILVLTGIIAAVLVIGLTIYIANEKHQEKLKYKIDVN